MRNASRGLRNSSSLSVSAPRTRLELTYARPDARALTEPRRAAKVRAMRRDVRADSVDAGLGRDNQAAPGVGLPRLHARDWDATWRPDDATRLRSSPTRSGRLPRRTGYSHSPVWPPRTLQTSTSRSLSPAFRPTNRVRPG